MNTEEYLTATEAGELIRVHPATIKRFISEGKLTKYSTGGKTLVNKQELLEFIKTK